MDKKTAIIIVAYQKTDFQKKCLEQCMVSVASRMKTPNTDIIILDDNHETDTLLEVIPGIIVQKTKFWRCGEVNAYVWACENRSKYDTFVFIHDSTIVLQALPLEVPDHFRPIWHSSKCMWNNMKGNINELFIELFKVKGESCKDIYNILCENKGSLVFGGMAIFDSTFAKFIAEETNFLDLAHMLNTRHLRSYFERIVYIIYCKFTDPSKFIPSSLCGDIFDHGNAMKNTTTIDKTLANNPYILKIWQGR